MTCPNCGEELAPGQLYCEKCGQEIQIVPDYDPLDELVIGQEESEIHISGYAEMYERAGKQEHTEKENDGKKTAHSILRKKRLTAGKKWILAFGALIICLGVSGGAYFLTTRESSYAYQLRRGRALVERESYEEAVPYLVRARELQAGTENADAELFLYLARAYAHTGEDSLAAECMEEAIDLETSEQEDETQILELYLEYMEILNMTGQTGQIEMVIEECSYPAIREELLPYRIDKPSCSVPEGTYSYYLRLELSADYGEIYYTLDGTAPTKESTLYEKPIELQEEGEVLLTAAAINEKGMVSEPLVLVYKLNFR